MKWKILYSHILGLFNTFSFLLLWMISLSVETFVSNVNITVPAPTAENREHDQNDQSHWLQSLCVLTQSKFISIVGECIEVRKYTANKLKHTRTLWCSSTFQLKNYWRPHCLELHTEKIWRTTRFILCVYMALPFLTGTLNTFSAKLLLGTCSICNIHTYIRSCYLFTPTMLQFHSPCMWDTPRDSTVRCKTYRFGLLAWKPILWSSKNNKTIFENTNCVRKWSNPFSVAFLDKNARCMPN